MITSSELSQLEEGTFTYGVLKDVRQYAMPHGSDPCECQRVHLLAKASTTQFTDWSVWPAFIMGKLLFLVALTYCRFVIF